MKKLLLVVLIMSLLLYAVPAFAADGDDVGELEKELEGEYDAGITPDSPLYFFDLLWEKVQYALTRSPQAKIELKAKFANERIAELEGLISERKSEHVEKVMINLQKNLEDIDAEIEIELKDLDNEDVNLDEVTNIFADANEEKAAILERISNLQGEIDALLASGDVPSEAAEGIINSVAAHYNLVDRMQEVTGAQAARLESRLQKMAEESAGDNNENAVQNREEHYEAAMQRLEVKNQKALEKLENALTQSREKAENQKMKTDDDDDDDIEEGQEEEQERIREEQEDAREDDGEDDNNEKYDNGRDEDRGEDDEEENDDDNDDDEDDADIEDDDEDDDDRGSGNDTAKENSRR